jgi:hypothetical protein
MGTIRVAMLVLQYTEFKQFLENGVRMKASRMRDAAGIIFRLYSFIVEGNWKVTPRKIYCSRNAKGQLQGACRSRTRLWHNLFTGNGTLHLHPSVQAEYEAVGGRREGDWELDRFLVS